LKAAVKRSRQCVCQRSFTNSRHVFNQQVAAGQQGNYTQPNSFSLASDDRLDSRLQTLDLFDRIGDDQRGITCYRFETSH
jgi:hypothetical protein